MKQLIPILILFFLGSFALAAPGGGKPHKVTSYDYHDYLNANIDKKIFVRYQDGGAKYSVEWIFDRTSAPGQVKRDEIKKNSSNVIVRHAMNVFVPTPDSFDWIEFNLCELLEGPCVAADTDTYLPPIESRTSAMVPGIAWGSAGVIENPVGTKRTYYTYKHEILAIEDVTVLAGTFTDCLKLHKLRQLGDIPDTRIEWSCPDMGIVKRIEGGKATMELEQVIFY